MAVPPGAPIGEYLYSIKAEWEQRAERLQTATRRRSEQSAATTFVNSRSEVGRGDACSVQASKGTSGGRLVGVGVVVGGAVCGALHVTDCRLPAGMRLVASAAHCAVHAAPWAPLLSAWWTA
jgi:hypothetical protein